MRDTSRDDEATGAGSTPTLDVVVVICTYRRNDPLRELLARLCDEASSTTEALRVGVAVADDSPEGDAAPVVAEFADRFELGARICNPASGNISVARNAGVELGLNGSDWLCFVDDDCLPDLGWFAHLFGIQRRTGADLVTGPIHDIAPPGAPRWLVEEPFLNLIAEYEDGTEPEFGTTANVLIRAAWLRDHPDVRFRPELGTLGGEDMEFFRAARRAGIVHRYSLDAVVCERVPPARTTLRYQLRNKFWFGNTIYVTNAEAGTNPNRLLLRGLRQIVDSVLRPLRRAVARESLQWRWALAGTLQGVGTVIGRFGVRVDHH
ncbi:MAG: glycosyltransferase family A protein [Microthrixaceae bacterium]